MQTLKIIKSIKSYKKDEVVIVENNEAHTLIDSGFAKLYKENRMMDLESPKQSKRFKVK